MSTDQRIFTTASCPVDGQLESEDDALGAQSVTGLYVCCL